MRMTMVAVMMAVVMMSFRKYRETRTKIVKGFIQLGSRLFRGTSAPQQCEMCECVSICVCFIYSVLSAVGLCTAIDEILGRCHWEGAQWLLRWPLRAKIKWRGDWDVQETSNVTQIRSLSPYMHTCLRILSLANYLSLNKNIPTIAFRGTRSIDKLLAITRARRTLTVTRGKEIREEN